MAHFVFKKAQAFKLAQRHPEADPCLVLAVIQVTSTSHKVGNLLWGRKFHFSKQWFTRDSGRLFNLTFQQGKCHPKQSSKTLTCAQGLWLTWVLTWSPDISPHLPCSAPPAEQRVSTYLRRWGSWHCLGLGLLSGAQIWAVRCDDACGVSIWAQGASMWPTVPPHHPGGPLILSLILPLSI